MGYPAPMNASAARLTVPGLEPVDGGWRAFAELAPEAQLARIRPWLERLRDVDAAPIAERARLPLGEVVASPFGLRAVAMAVEVGATTVDRETRALLDWQVEGAVADERHGVWESGRLHVGKYQAFLQDAPFATYDPAHVAKWGPHELMHRAAGFFWRRGMTRFEHYLGARLNELLPVALWYGPDQLLRLREDGFERASAAREANETDARWCEETDDDHLRRTLRWLRRGFDHVATELDAIDRERRSGRCIPTPHHVGGATLNASSDALAYVVAHHERLEQPAVADALHGSGAFASVDEYRAHIEERWEALLFGDRSLDFAAIERQRSIRVEWDQRLRRALAGEGADPDSVAADGLEAFDLGQLYDGLLSVAPRLADIAEERDPEWLERFAFGPAIRQRAPLGDRLARFLAESDPELAELARFEQHLATIAPGDRARLASDQGTRLARDDAFTLERFAHDVVALHAGAQPTEGPHAALIGRTGDDVQVIPLEPAVATFWDQLGDQAADEEQARTTLGDDWIDTLLQAGALHLY